MILVMGNNQAPAVSKIKRASGFIQIETKPTGTMWVSLSKMTICDAIPFDTPHESAVRMRDEGRPLTADERELLIDAILKAARSVRLA
jgi:hypothetical protein